MARDRALLAEVRQHAPGESAAPPAEVAPPAPGPAPPPAAADAGLDGRYFVRDGRTLDTWDFHADGTFHHVTILGGAGVSARHAERGTYRLDGGSVVLTVKGEAGGFAATRPGGEGAMGGGSEAKDDTRRLRIELRGPRGRDGLVLGGVELRPRSW